MAGKRHVVPTLRTLFNCKILAMNFEPSCNFGFVIKHFAAQALWFLPEIPSGLHRHHILGGGTITSTHRLPRSVCRLSHKPVVSRVATDAVEEDSRTSGAQLPSRLRECSDSTRFQII